MPTPCTTPPPPGLQPTCRQVNPGRVRTTPEECQVPRNESRLGSPRTCLISLQRPGINKHHCTVEQGDGGTQEPHPKPLGTPDRNLFCGLNRRSMRWVLSSSGRLGRQSRDPKWQVQLPQNRGRVVWTELRRASWSPGLDRGALPHARLSAILIISFQSPSRTWVETLSDVYRADILRLPLLLKP